MDAVAIVVCALSIDTDTALGTGDTGARISKTFTAFAVLTSGTSDPTTRAAFARISLTFPIDAGFGIIASYRGTGGNTGTGAAELVGSTLFRGTRVVFALSVDTAFTGRTAVEVAIFAHALSARTNEIGGAFDETTRIKAATSETGLSSGAGDIATGFANTQTLHTLQTLLAFAVAAFSDTLALVTNQLIRADGVVIGGSIAIIVFAVANFGLG